MGAQKTNILRYFAGFVQARRANGTNLSQIQKFKNSRLARTSVTQKRRKKELKQRQNKARERIGIH